MGRIHGGSSGTKTWLWILSWYTCSLVTLFMNKIILNKPKSSPQLLGVFQMLSTAILGGVKVLLARRRRDGARVASETPPLRDIAMLGSLRAATVLLGLFAISHVAVSFVEAVKSSAPLFTAVFAWIILRDRISFRVGVTLLPCVVGLAIASATELSFDAIGFSAAAACNVLDCIQNVLSKRVLRVTNPVHLQFYTSAAAALIQVPFTMYMLGSAGGGAESGTETAGVASWLPSFLLAPGLRFSWSNFALPSRELTSWLLLASVSYHLQSVCAYCTMNTVTPLTMSVANTVKRGILIVLSIIYFGNDVGALTYAGMILIMGGAFACVHFLLLYSPGLSLESTQCHASPTLTLYALTLSFFTHWLAAMGTQTTPRRPH